MTDSSTKTGVSSPNGPHLVPTEYRERRVRIRGLTKVFRLHDSVRSRLLQAVTGISRSSRSVRVLHDIDLDVAAGECVGIMGPNGAGKSTLLRILTGSLYPTSGDVEIQGRVTLLDLGSGLNRELSGLDNLWSLGTALGLSSRELGRRLDEIIEFSELGDAIRATVKTYSTGMAMRLAFSLYAHTDPDVLVIDEAFAVGDARFVLKCTRRLEELRSRGTAILLASHDGNAIAQLCSHAIVIDAGRICFAGDPIAAVDAYHSALGLRPVRADTSSAVHAPLPADVEAFLASAIRRPSVADTGSVSILGLRVLRNDKPSSGVFAYGDECRVEWLVRAHQPLASFTTGVHLHEELGTYVFGTSYVHLGRRLSLPEPGHYLFSISFPMRIAPGRYVLSLGAAEPDFGIHALGGRQLDRFRDACSLEVLPFELAPEEPVPFFGLMSLPAKASEPVRLEESTR